MKTYYLEITKKRGNPQIEKIKATKDYKAIEMATKVLKANRNIKEIKINEVVTNQYCSIITR